MKRIDNKKNLYKSIILLVIVLIGIGYAYLTSNLSISGQTEVVANTWNIHFENLNVSTGSVTASTPATIQTNNVDITYAITLSRPKDYYEFTVDVKNDGTLPGKVSISTLSGITTDAESIIDYTVKYKDGTPVNVGDILNAGKKKTIKVRVFYKDDIDSTDFPDNDLNLTLTYTLQYVQSETDAPGIYDELINLSSTNTCFTKYNDDITDSVGLTKTASNVYFDECEDKRYVIFGNSCWQIIRTTETGGVKMLFYGAPVDGSCQKNRGTYKTIIGAGAEKTDFDSSYLYGSSISYNTTTNEFTLEDTTTATWSDSTYENILGKYTCKSLSDTCNFLYYMNSYVSNTKAAVARYTIGSTYFSNAATSAYNADGNSVSTVGYMFNKIYEEEYATTGTNSYKFGNSFSYDNNTYTLTGSTQNYTNLNNIGNYHYTCWDDTGICSTISYVTDSYSNRTDYVNLTGGKDITTAVHEMLLSEDVNMYNSAAKAMVDLWYSKNLIGKTNMLEDTVFCNARNITNYGGWDPNYYGYSDLSFKNIRAKDLSCPNITDQFAVGNNKAKLTYPVALTMNEEFQNFIDKTVFKTSDSMWSITPAAYSTSNSTSMIVIYGIADIGLGYSGYNRGIRPVISLKGGNVISEGDGSATHPWVID